MRSGCSLQFSRPLPVSFGFEFSVEIAKLRFKVATVRGGSPGRAGHAGRCDGRLLGRSARALPARRRDVGHDFIFEETENMSILNESIENPDRKLLKSSFLKRRNANFKKRSVFFQKKAKPSYLENGLRQNNRFLGFC